MGLFFAYSLKSAICLALFYLFYKVLLSKETFHRFNRIALLSMMGLAVGVPFLATVSQQTMEIQSPFQVTIATDEIQALLIDAEPVGNLSPNNWLTAFLLVYLAGVLFCLLRSIWGIARLIWLIRKGKRTMLANKLNIFVHQNHRIAPFSWMKYIVISQADLDEAGEAILVHEQAHIRYRHTADLFLAEICIIFQWYNPAAWLLYRELQTIHEFEADESVINQGIDAKQYQLLLIKKAVGTRLYSMANSFNHSNLKKRITMMLQKKSSSWARLKYAYVLPLAAITVVAFARPEISQPFDEISSVKVSHFVATIEPVEAANVLSEVVRPVEVVNELSLPAIMPEDTTVFIVVEEMPEFLGGHAALMSYLAENLKYPVKMMEEKTEGRVTVSYVVTKDGHIRDARIVRGVNATADTEALRVVNAMPQWKPGKQGGKVVNVKYTLPIVFKLPK